MSSVTCKEQVEVCRRRKNFGQDRSLEVEVNDDSPPAMSIHVSPPNIIIVIMTIMRMIIVNNVYGRHQLSFKVCPYLYILNSKDNDIKKICQSLLIISQDMQ